MRFHESVTPNPATHTLLGLTLASALVALAACAPPAQEPDPRGVLEASAEALRAVETVRYEFTYGGPDDPTGWLTGTVLARQRESPAVSWLRIEGTVHAQPNQGVEERRFAYGSDGETAWAWTAAGEEPMGRAPVESAPVGAGSNLLSATAAYGWLPEMVEAEPLWRELRHAEALRFVEPETLAGEPCDVVHVTIATEQGPSSEVRWSIAREDRLPRRGRWYTPLSGPDGMTLTLTEVETGVDLERSDFAPPGETSDPASRTAAVGEPAPDWALLTPDGESVRLSDLAGSVVVLDFWNTWCPVCRSIGPDTRALARELADEPVRFFGVNLYETSDPAAYWREIGEPYPLLLEGEEVARALDLPWQPGIAVIGPEGTLLYKQLGASADRIEKVRAAIEEGLERAPTGR
jgi:thiol-disulfide isomerase/thioredoxin